MGWRGGDPNPKAPNRTGPRGPNSPPNRPQQVYSIAYCSYITVKAPVKRSLGTWGLTPYKPRNVVYPGLAEDAEALDAKRPHGAGRLWGVPECCANSRPLSFSLSLSRSLSLSLSRSASLCLSLSLSMCICIGREICVYTHTYTER